ncbi:MAG TPA: glycosyltransferase, partial [Puia sp.]
MYKNSPLVSIVIPTYNREKFIGSAIRSVLEQTYKNLEVIIVDDGSQDRTKEIVHSFQDERVIYFYQTNKGRSVARNFALKHAKGSYVTFLDSDDLYYKDKIEKQVRFLEKNKKFSMVYTSANCIDEEGRSLSATYQATDAGWIYLKVAYFVGTTITLPTVMVRQEVFSVVGEFDEQMHRFEDTDMWRRISKKYRIGAMQDATCLLRTHSDNILKNQNPREILSNLKYYINKILSEDKKYYDFHQKGINKLLQYYEAAFLSVPDFSVYADEILEINKYISEKIELKIKIKRKLKRYVQRIKNLIKSNASFKKKKKILFIAFPDSIHTVRWINHVSRDDYDVYLAPVYATEPHQSFENQLTVFYPFRSYFYIGIKSFINHFFLAFSFQNSLSKMESKNIRLNFIYNLPFSLTYIRKKFSEWYKFGNSEAVIMKSFGPSTLKKIIKKIKPDLIHSLEFQTCGYNVLFTKKQYKKRKFPPWLATNWGSDIFFYKNDPAHLEIIKDLLSKADYYSCECHRD